MKKFILAILLLTVSFIHAEEKLGKEISLKTKTAVSKILSKPASFEGKTVLVEGKVVGVCQEKGCWIDLAGSKKGQKIRVKVADGEIVFPKDSKGKTALVEGTVEEVKSGMACDEDMKKDDKAKMDMKECDAKMADAKSKDAKEDDCCAGSAKKVYQIKGLSAVIK